MATGRSAKEKSTFCILVGCISLIQRDMYLIYLEDVIVFSTTLSDHLKCLPCVFNRQAARLKLKQSICHLLQKQFQHLEYIVCQSGINADPAKTQEKMLPLFQRY